MQPETRIVINKHPSNSSDFLREDSFALNAFPETVSTEALLIAPLPAEMNQIKLEQILGVGKTEGLYFIYQKMLHRLIKTFLLKNSSQSHSNPLDVQTILNHFNLTLDDWQSIKNNTELHRFIGKQKLLRVSIELSSSLLGGSLNLTAMLPLSMKSGEQVNIAFPSLSNAFIQYLIVGNASINFLFLMSMLINSLKHMNEFYLRRIKGKNLPKLMKGISYEAILIIVALGSVLAWVSLVTSASTVSQILVGISLFFMEWLGTAGFLIPFIEFFEWCKNPNRQWQFTKFSLMIILTVLIAWTMFMPVLVSLNHDFNNPFLNSIKYCSVLTASGFGLITAEGIVFKNDLKNFTDVFKNYSQYWLILIILIALAPGYAINFVSSDSHLKETYQWNDTEFFLFLTKDWVMGTYLNLLYSVPTAKKIYDQFGEFIYAVKNPVLDGQKSLEAITTAEAPVNSNNSSVPF